MGNRKKRKIVRSWKVRLIGLKLNKDAKSQITEISLFGWKHVKRDLGWVCKDEGGICSVVYSEIYAS